MKIVSRYVFLFVILFFQFAISQDIQEILSNDICSCVDNQIKNFYKKNGSYVLENCLSRKIENYTPDLKSILIEEKFVEKNGNTYGASYNVNLNNLNAFIAGHQSYFVNECNSYYWYASALRAQRLIDTRYTFRKDNLKALSRKIKKGKNKKAYLYERALIYMSHGEYEKAKADFYNCQEEEPDDDDMVTYHLAWTCELNGEYGVAKSWYKEMIKKNNHFEAILGLEITNRKIRERAKIDSVLFFAQYNRLNNIKEVAQKKITKSNERIERPPSPISCKHIEDNQELKKCFSSYFKRFVDKHFNLNIIEYTNLKSGIHRIFTKFKVSKEGMITNIFVLNDDPFIVNEITRILTSIPRLEPGTVNGEPVGVFYSFPLMFSTVE